MTAVFSILGSVLVGIGKSLLTEKFIKWAVLKCGEMLVKKTSTPHDDVWFEEMKKHINGEKK